MNGAATPATIPVVPAFRTLRRDGNKMFHTDGALSSRFRSMFGNPLKSRHRVVSLDAAETAPPTSPVPPERFSLCVRVEPVPCHSLNGLARRLAAQKRMVL